MRKCEVCGARVSNLNPKTTTCDPICTRAKHSGLTRELQIKKELRSESAQEAQYDRERIYPKFKAFHCPDCQRTDPHRHCTECGSTGHLASTCDMLG